MVTQQEEHVTGSIPPRSLPVSTSRSNERGEWSEESREERLIPVLVSCTRHLIREITAKKF